MTLVAAGRFAGRPGPQAGQGHRGGCGGGVWWGRGGGALAAGGGAVAGWLRGGGVESLGESGGLAGWHDRVRSGGAAMASPGRRAGGRTRWRRFAVVLVPALAAAAGLVVLTAQSVLAVSFSLSGTPFVVTARELRGQGFEQFGVLDHSVINVLPGHANQIVLTANGIRTATLTDLCQSVSLGGLTMRITAGTGGTPVRASDLLVDADRLSGNARFTHIAIGQDASTLNQVPGVRGQAGTFGEQAATVTISNLFQHAYSTTAGEVFPPGLSLPVHRALP